MAVSGAKGSIITLQDVQNYFYGRDMRDIPAEKISKLYYLIDDHGYVCVRNPDMAWAPSADEYDERMACNEIVDILELDHSIIDEYYMVVAAAVNDVNFRFGDMTVKDKIAFYIAVLHQLLPDE